MVVVVVVVYFLLSEELRACVRVHKHTQQARTYQDEPAVGRGARGPVGRLDGDEEEGVGAGGRLNMWAGGGLIGWG